MSSPPKSPFSSSSTISTGPPPLFAGETLRGDIARSRITVIDTEGHILPRHLNKHIDYGSCCAPIPNDENERSLAFPLQMEVTRDGRTLYVAPARRR